MTIRAIDLFCGGGGSSWGARAAGVRMVGAVDAWDVATAVYADNFPTARRNILTYTLSDAVGPEIFDGIGKVDLLIASPECTNHSIARGARERCEQSQRSGWYVKKFIEDLTPRWIILENVNGMRQWNGFEGLIAELRRHGYNLRLQSLDSASFGVPQNRKRLFIMGDRREQPRAVQPTAAIFTAASKIICQRGAWRTSPLFKEGRATATLDRAKSAIAALGAGTPFLIVYYGSDRAGGWQTLDRPLRTLTTLDRFALVTWENGEARMRMLQVPELMAAMGIDAPYRMERGTRRDKIRILGNGVAAPVMQAVVETLTGSSAIAAAA
ncbi:MAG TPA: DNA cytosine methyltransferase [Caulobacteraceae bacterium]